VTVVNTSTAALSGPLDRVPVALTNGTGNQVPVVNASGQFHGFPYMALLNSALQPESTSVVLEFGSVASTPIYFAPKVFLANANKGRRKIPALNKRRCDDPSASPLVVLAVSPLLIRDG
jgi:hypothetical protein